MYRRQPAEAEALLLGAGLVYRAVKLNVKLFRWQRALELAQKHRQHVDTVLLYRSRWVGVRVWHVLLRQQQQAVRCLRCCLTVAVVQEMHCLHDPACPLLQ